MKLAADPALPGLTAETLPWSATAIFAGWLVGSISLKQALETFSKAQFLAASSVLLCLSTLATVTLPHLTGGNIVVFSAVRFVTGLLFATGPVGNLYVQDCLPSSRRNQAMAFINTAYSIMAVLMATTCGMFQSWDWRVDAMLWCGLPPLLAFFIAFNKPFTLLSSIPSTLRSKGESSESSKSSESEFSMSPSIFKAALQLGVCFLACGVGSYGLSYSAGKLSENLYTNSVLLNSADILGYITVLGADFLGRKTFQTGSYVLAAFSLLLCGILEPGSWSIVACAMGGRICLNVAFTTIYVALAEVFPERSQKNVLPICQIAARLGGILAPLSGTLPAAVSCPAFGSACLAAALATVTMPDRLQEKQEAERQRES
ncbi:Solute carrier family 22 member 6-B (Organic cation transporter 1-B) (Renal organic anion transporter 1-B) (ROAT1-B) [Durusdinium trenchii]|uniref:Solute carrier family 22 member 6-B (Organic cation transporter 1-B) (Renal organic anion transporter 1-B) (ROAT1-B) n=1 Tax=Durusdinium trenchii TaxID=1381693 RepID=A0ABP0HYH4_9DINO